MATALPEKMSQPALRALESIQVKHLEDLSTCTEKQLLGLHGFGPSGMRVLKAAMAEKGIQFKKS